MLSPLARALPALTALQATVALGMFALSALAPQLGLTVAQLAALNTLLFGVGALVALNAGRLLGLFGDWGVALACAAAVAAGMACLLWGGAAGPWFAAALFGLAFGPETPASASVLSRLTPAARRPWVFSVRQTGNQIGAMLGSLLLPVLIVIEPRLPYWVVGAVGVLMAAWCWTLSRGDGLRQGPIAEATTAMSPRAALRSVRATPSLSALAFAALCFTAVQMCLNTFLLSLAVRDWQLDVTTASRWVAGMQAAGLAGRLFWGWLAQRSEQSRRLLGALGVMMATAGLVVIAWPGPRSGVLLAASVAALGFTASGWNGVLVAEVSRVAGPRDAGAVTGAVLMFGYAGLALSPLAFAASSAAASMSTAFAMLFALASVAGFVLLWGVSRTPPA